MNAVISIENVCKSFQATRALDGVSFEIPPGEIFGLLGPNGAGKTTLMRILIGILAPDAGRVRIHGESARSLKERIGYLPEERGLYPKMKIQDLLRFCGSIKGMSSRELPGRIAKGLERVGLAGQENKPVLELSKGNQQRVQLLITLLHRPDILILDEPFTGLDPIGVDQMKGILREEAERGATVLISTHGMEDAEQLCKQIALIHRGRLICCSDLQALKDMEGRDELIVQCEGEEPASRDDPGLLWTSLGNRTFRVRLTNGTPVPQVIRMLAQRMDLTNIRRVEPRLHDIFVRLVGQEANTQ